MFGTHIVSRQVMKETCMHCLNSINNLTNWFSSKFAVQTRQNYKGNFRNFYYFN